MSISASKLSYGILFHRASRLCKISNYLKRTSALLVHQVGQLSSKMKNEHCLSVHHDAFWTHSVSSGPFLTLFEHFYACVSVPHQASLVVFLAKRWWKLPLCMLGVVPVLILRSWWARFTIAKQCPRFCSWFKVDDRQTGASNCVHLNPNSFP